MLFAPKRMWMKPSHFFLPCRPPTTPRATKRTTNSGRLWNGYYAYRTRKLRVTACLGEHTLTWGQPRPLVSLNCLYLRREQPISEKTYQSPLPILKPSHRLFCFFTIATRSFTATYSLRMGRSWCYFVEVVGHIQTISMYVVSQNHVRVSTPSCDSKSLHSLPATLKVKAEYSSWNVGDKSQ
jgi:hypothetical protein